MTQGLHSKFLLSTLDLIAAINTNYASLSVKLRRTPLRSSSSIQAEGQTEQLFLIPAMSVEREQPDIAGACPSCCKLSFSHFSHEYLLFSAQDV